LCVNDLVGVAATERCFFSTITRPGKLNIDVAAQVVTASVAGLQLAG